jgi:zinc transporter ZupT
MNYKMLFFAGVVTMVIGMGLGMVLAVLLPTPYQGGLYREQKRSFIVVGAAGGLLVGMSQEAIRQLKQKQDRE